MKISGEPISRGIDKSKPAESTDYACFSGPGQFSMKWFYLLYIPHEEGDIYLSWFLRRIVKELSNRVLLRREKLLLKDECSVQSYGSFFEFIDSDSQYTKRD
jgi:hypothetical protein